MRSAVSKARSNATSKAVSTVGSQVASQVSRCVAIAATTVFVTSFAVGALPQAGYAQSLIDEVKLGILYHDAPNLWSGFRLEREAADINLEVLFRPSFPLLIGSIRPVVGGSVSTLGDTSHAYAGLRWQVEMPMGLFFGLGLGAAVHDGHTLPDKIDRKALGSRALFHIPAEIGWRFDGHNSISVYFEHTSNAWLAKYNEGMDRIGLRYGYRF